MKKLIILLIVACSLHTSAQQSFRPATSAAAAGFSAERLQRIDSFYNEMVKKGDVPNAVTFIARNGQIVHHKAYGFSNLEKQIPAKTSDIFRIASQTKLITTIAMMMLYEEGKFLLDDPIDKYLPEFRNVQVLVSYDKTTHKLETRAPKSRPTIRQLLSHTAGIPYEMALDSQLVGNITDLGKLLDMSTEAVVKELAKRPLAHDPGEHFTYGYNIDVAGRIVEVLSGKLLNDFFQERIFQPLGMNDTYFYLPSAKYSRLVELYSKRDAGQPITVSTDQANRDFATGDKRRVHMGGEGLVSTASDYAKICQLILNGGEFNNKRLLSRKTVALMSRNQIGNNEVWDRHDKFGLGFQLITGNTTYADQASVGSLTWGGAYCSEYTIDPTEKLVMLVFTNIYPYTYYGEFVRKFRILTYQALQ
ncbi:MAG: serine hydrolase [Candidatus Pseudobacter hemicellulosilyticus]|uniref:Serine hydrolase n=1 Tax=Candidatus Pseudobacter hemicellulosilyticus TaxID=3121375 RepID=A0AAJ5WSY2_9BACT|nr:MAG: serine hydrolase [Pseudobacter sp.]